MSQQKVILALCLVACFVAAVSSQWSFDANNCSQSLQANLDEFRSKFTENMNRCVEDLSAQGQNAVDRETISKETTSIMNSLSSLMSADSLDSSRWMSVMQGVATSYMRIMGSFARPSAGLGVWQTNVRCIASSTQYYTNLMTSMPAGCIGTNNLG